MEFEFVCKVCKTLVDEHELFGHIKKHEPIFYYDVLPKTKW